MCAIWSPPPPRRGYPVTPRKKRTPRKAATADTRKVSSTWPASRLRMKNGRVRGFSIRSEATLRIRGAGGQRLAQSHEQEDTQDQDEDHKSNRSQGVESRHS